MGKSTQCGGGIKDGANQENVENIKLIIQLHGGWPQCPGQTLIWIVRIYLPEIPHAVFNTVAM